MTSCKDIYGFLTQVSARNCSAAPADADLALLTELKLVQLLTPDQYQKAAADLQALQAEQAAYAQELGQRAALVSAAQEEARRTHSILFRLEGQEKRSEELERESQSEASLKSVDSDLAQKQQQIGQLVAQRTLLDSLTPLGTGYVGLTGLGTIAVRDLGTALYRVSDTEFGAYWEQAQRISHDLEELAASGADYYARLSPSLVGADRSHLWAISLGLSKAQPDASAGAATFVADYNQIAGLSPNLENRLLSAEVLFSLPRPLAEEMPTLTPLLGDVRKLGVAPDSALGIASILLLGRRADGVLATPLFQQYLQLTRSYESAALLAIMNLPVADQSSKFQELRALFTGWGYQPSEDVELSSAYLTVSELPVEGISTKLAIIAKGLSTYLEYPLVAASVLAALSTLEANETLNLLERAYEVVGRRASPMSQAELICLAVRMLHGIRNELVGPLDATAAAVPSPRVPGYYGPRFFFVPIVVVHGAYYSTFSAFGGAHPGHAHGFAGGGGGFSG